MFLLENSGSYMQFCGTVFRNFNHYSAKSKKCNEFIPLGEVISIVKYFLGLKRLGFNFKKNVCCFVPDFGSH